MATARDLLLNLKEKRQGNALIEAAEDLEKLSRGIDASGDKMKDFTKDAEALEVQMQETEARIKDLGAQFAKTGDRSIFGDIRKERSFLKELQKISKELEDAGSSGIGVTLGSAIGSSTGKGILDSIGSIPSVGRGTLITAAVGIGALMAPAIGGIIAGAVTGIAGIGGIAGGIGAASRDPGVRGAAKRFGETVAMEFFGSGAPFIQPTMKALDDLGDAFLDLNIGETFERAAPFVDDLVTGISGLAKEFMPGFNEALDNAGPAMAVLADELPEVGDALGDMIADMSASEGAAQGLQYALEILEGSMRVLGSTTNALGDAFNEMIKYNANLTGDFEDIFNVISYGNPIVGVLAQKTAEMNNHLEEMDTSTRIVGVGAEFAVGKLVSLKDDGIDPATGSMRDYAGTTEDLAEAQERANEALDKFLAKNLNVDAATVAAQKGLLALKEQLKDNKGEWDANTEKGLANRDMLLDQVRKYQDLRDAAIASGMKPEEADRIYNAQIKKLEKLAEAAGASKDVLKDLVGDHYIHINVKVHTTGKMKGDWIDPEGLIPKRAAGGPVMPNRPYLVGERGPELFVPTQSGNVMSNSLTRATGGAMSTSMGTDARPIVVNGNPAFQAMFNEVVREVQRRGGTLAVIGIRER